MVILTLDQVESKIKSNKQDKREHWVIKSHAYKEDMSHKSVYIKWKSR